MGPVVTDFIIEVALRIPGYLVLRLIRGAKIKDAEVDKAWAVIAGILFWLLLAIVGLGIHLSLPASH